jgi:hypothetical protein
VNDASVMLKPLLSRGEVRCLGCTSLDKYRKFIEKDPGLERRFQQVGGKFGVDFLLRCADRAGGTRGAGPNSQQK